MADSPFDPRPEVKAARPELALVRDLCAGTPAMHEAGGRYIRMWSAEDPANYAIRATCEQLYEGFPRVLSASVGMLFRHAPRLTYTTETTEPVFAPIVYDVDGAGTHLFVAAKSFAEVALRDGYAIILVDHPPTPPNASLADEIALGLRPVWSVYERASVVSWRTARYGGREVVTQLVLFEPATVDDGQFGVKQVPQVRVLQVTEAGAQWALVRDHGADGMAVVSSGTFTDRAGAAFDALPIAVAYTGRKEAPFVCRPPLMGVAYENLGHYQLSTALRFYLELSAYPQPVVTGSLQPVQTSTGVQAGSLGLGPMVAIHLQAGASFQWSELQGTSLEALRRAVEEKLQGMASLGLSFLARSKRTTETAEARRLDSAGENSTLSTAGHAIADALNVALSHTARYLGIADADAPTLELGRLDERPQVGAAELTAVAALAREGFPRAVLLELLQNAGIVGADADLLELAMDWDAGAGAARLEAPTLGTDTTTEGEQ
jgi:hypothetical protein